MSTDRCRRRRSIVLDVIDVQSLTQPRPSVTFVVGVQGPGPGQGATTAPADLRRGPAPPGPQAQNRMALGVKGGGMWGQWYTLSPPPPVGEMPKTRLTRSEGPPTPSPG